MNLQRTLFGTRQNALTTILFTAAFVICGIAWMRFFSVAATNPSPVRYLEFVGEEGAIAPFRQDCAGPAFIEQDIVWRFCEYADGSVMTPAPWGLARLDLKAGRAELRWPLPESAQGQVLALAQAPSGALATAWGEPDLHSVYLIRQAGGVDALGLPADRPASLVGLAWASPDTLELVTDAEGGAAIYTYAAGTWSAPRLLAAPAVCGAESAVCALQLAHRTESGWRAIYAAAPHSADPAAQVVILAVQEGGPARMVLTLPVSDLDPAQLTRDDAGMLVAIGALFDRAPGGTINWALQAAPFMLHGDTWQRVAAPQPGASFYYADYTILAGGLGWIPGTRYPQRSWHLNEWVTLHASGEEVFLAGQNGAPGPALTRSAALGNLRGAETTLLPASDGGFWVLGPYGAYLKATASLQRADSLNLLERAQAVIANFGERGALAESFYQEQRALKLAAFPLVLLSLPTGYALVFYVRQTRRDRRAWLRLLLRVSAVYLVVATVFIWWFWELMDTF